MTTTQMSLLEGGSDIPDLASFDLILVNTSAGKDSQAMLDYLVELADGAGCRSRLVAVHCDLGRVEWQGTAELAEEQAAHYGVRFEKVSRPQGDLLTQIEARGMFPSSTARYCTSDQKTGQVKVLITRLVKELEHLGRPVRILNCLGLRAQESPARAKKVALGPDSASNSKRDITRWLPIFDWTTEQVWTRIRRSGVRHHWAYDEGMPRLSCCFCVLASRSSLVRAAQLNPELAQEYRAVEVRIGHTIQSGTSMADIISEAEAATSVQVEDWACA
jgi:3'-phosphoadenosine 5'-phosphosulfate sulfotransferase (PAPS reductase)/FAD synthetase